MKKLTLLLLFSAVATVASANLITDGSFDPGTTIASIGKDGHERWDWSIDQLNRWYTWADKDDGPFYVVHPDGYVEPVRAAWDDDPPPGNSIKSMSADVIPAKILQVIQAPVASDYEFSFRYRLTDPALQYGFVRVLGIEDTGHPDFTIRLDKWQPDIGNAQDDTLYDQGGFQSELPGVAEWTTVTTVITVSDHHDFLAIYGVFSYDGWSTTSDWAALDDFSLMAWEPGSGTSDPGAVPEPATYALAGMGFVGLLACRRRRSPSPPGRGPG